MRALLIAPLFATSVLHAQDRVAARIEAMRRIPAGAATVTLDAATIRASGARTLPELLAGRVAGLSVTYASGLAGIAPRIHVRGSTGVVGAPEPWLVIDGIRMRADQQVIGALVNTIPNRELLPSFAWDIPVDQIERVEIVLGAAGGAYLEYGAARGAVLVTTRRPSKGAPHVEASLESIMPSTPTGIPDNYGTGSAEIPFLRCTLAAQAAGDCTPTTHERWNPLNASGLLAPRTGMRAGLSGSGGFAGGAWRSSASFERGVSLLADKDGLDRASISGAFTRAFGDRIDIEADVRYRRATGYYGPSNLLLESSLFSGSPSLPLADYAGAPGPSFEYLSVAHRVDQLVMGTQLRMEVTERLQAAARIGVDKGQRFSERTRPPAGPFEGSRNSLSARDAGRSISVDLTYDHTLRRGIGGSTLVTATLLRGWPAERAESISTSGSPDSTWTTVTGEARHVTIAVSERMQLGVGRSIGIGARHERFGKGDFVLESGLLPSIDVAWAIRDNSLGARSRFVNGIKLRAAHGTGVEHPVSDGFAWTQPLPPELQRLTETELGVNVGLLRDEATLDVATFRRQMSDAMYLMFIGPGTGLFQGASWTISGVDLALTVAPIRVGPLAWRSTVSASFLHYGGRGGGGFFFVGGWTARNESPIGTISKTGYTFDDANDDGIIVPSEVTATAGPIDAGNSQPRRIFALNTSFALGDRLSFGGLIDGKGGHVAMNFTEAWRCTADRCRALYDPQSSLADQARAVVVSNAMTSNPLSAFVEDASFVRLRELWLRFRLGRRDPNLAGATELVLTARNLATWTGYSGVDPEVGSLFGAGLRIGEDRSYPLMRSVSAELRMAW